MKQLNTKLLSILLVLGLILNFQVLAQDNKVTGSVKDGATSEALIGASILIKGTKVGTATDASGNFSITAKSSDVLIFSYVGYESKEVSINNQTVIGVSLSGTKVLSEVIVT